MGYSSKRFEKKGKERPWDVHPIWRGIGCILIVLMPIIAWACAELFMQSQQIFNLPTSWYRPVAIPLTTWQPLNVILSGIDSILSSLSFTGGTIFLTLLFLIIGYGLLILIYAVVYRIFGPPRYTQVDAKPIVVHKQRRH
jgi:hypothetical protein